MLPLHMSPQVALARRCEAAALHLAKKGLDARVRALVGCVVAPAFSRVVAPGPGAPKGLVTRVRAHVRIEVGALRARVPTPLCFANERLLARVGPHVRGEVV
jgi:hypothetical protein